MTIQATQRGKDYLETARTLLRAAKTMTDAAIASQLRALADDYQQRAVSTSQVDVSEAPKRSAGAEQEGDPRGRFKAPSP
jgi:hypothetical protein